MDDNQKRTRWIMRKVYGIWFLRQMAPIVVGMPLFLVLALWLIAREFFVAKIVENFTNSLYSGNVLTITNFIGSALYNASAHLVSISIIGFSIGLVLILGYKLVRNFMRLTLVRV